MHWSLCRYFYNIIIHWTEYVLSLDYVQIRVPYVQQSIMSTYNGVTIKDGKAKSTRGAIKKKALESISLTNLQKVSVLPWLWLYNKVKKNGLSLCLPMFYLELKKKFLFINLLSKLLLGSLDNLENVGWTREKLEIRCMLD